MDAQHPFEWRARELHAGRHVGQWSDFFGWDKQCLTATRNLVRMNSRSRTLKPTANAAPHLAWIHDGVRHRASVWPDVVFEREAAPGEWEACDVTEGACASAAASLKLAMWARYLEFMPAAERDFVLQFRFGKMAALQVLVRCPSLVPELQACPALTSFVAAHVSLRGGEAPAWSELEAVFERGGIFSVLQWLGLPSSRQTLAILRAVADPDLPRRLLAPLRATLWEPEAIWMLAHAGTLNDADLTRACHALAA